MNVELLFDEPYARITYEAAHDMICLELKGVIGGDDYRKTFNTLMDKGLEKNINKLYVNQATMDRSTMEAKAWLVTNWLPRVKKAFGDDVKVALILSKNLFTKIGGEFIVNTVKAISKFDIKTFSSTDDAREWIIK